MSQLEQQIRSFAVLMGKLDGGKFNNHASDAVDEVVKTLTTHAATHGRATGKMRVEITFAIEDNVLDVSATMATTLPKTKHGRSVFFTGEGGGVFITNPRQQLLPLREVGAASAAPREA